MKWGTCHILIMSFVIYELLIFVIFINNGFAICFFFSGHILIASSLECDNDNSTTLVSMYYFTTNPFWNITYNSTLKILASGSPLMLVEMCHHPSRKSTFHTCITCFNKADLLALFISSPPPITHMILTSISELLFHLWAISAGNII